MNKKWVALYIILLIVTWGFTILNFTPIRFIMAFFPTIVYLYLIYYDLKGFNPFRREKHGLDSRR